MNEAESLARKIEKGGVYYGVSGATVEDVYADAIPRLSLPAGVDSTLLLAGLAERERLMTTAIGGGIALPHPRTPLVSSEKDERIYVCFLDKPVSFNAMDGKPVFVLFIILSAGPKSHLNILSRLSWLFQQESFQTILKEKPDTRELADAIRRHFKVQGALS